MEITGRKCLEAPDMKLGFEKAKVTCFNVNPFHDDYYKKAIYHRNNEQPTKKQIEEGSSKEKKQGVLTIRESSSGCSMRDQEDEGFVGFCMPKTHIKLMWLVRYDPSRVIPKYKLDKHL
ncbi:hypothetical protein Hanom_Chr10g00909711 [Helianthus anomalus]